MHIVHVIDTLKIGGAEKLILTFADMLRATEHSVTIVTLKPILDDQKKVAEDLGLRVVEYPAMKIQDPKRFFRLVEFLRSEKPDILHAHLSMGTILGLSAAKVCRILAVTTVHNTAFNEQPESIRSRLETWVTNNFSAGVIAVGRTVKECHIDRLSRQEIAVIPNAASEPITLDQGSRTSLRRELAKSDDRIIFASVGRLTEQKGISDLLKAFAKVTARFPLAHLLIVGRGSLLDDLITEGRELGLQECVSFLGFRQDVREILASSDVFVNSSLWEGMPVSTLEAMAQGLPCIITRTGDAEDLLETTPENICSPGNPMELATRMIAMAEEPESRRDAGKAMFEAYKKNHKPSVWAERTIQYYSRILEQESAAT